MKIGFVGAGKVGFTLGKYFSINGVDVTGYYDSDESSSSEASSFTGSECFKDINILLGSCDALFLTVPDSLITSVYNTLDKEAIKGKLICHCSGVMGSKEAFPDATLFGAYICSVHPLMAVSSRYDSYRDIVDGFFAVEGCTEGVKMISQLLLSLGNDYQVISGECKRKYHLAGAVASNLAVGLMDMSISLLTECGFTRDKALKALSPIMVNNIKHIAENDVTESLTGPVERCDTSTVKKHLDVLSGEDKELYMLLSKRILNIAENKNPLRDYRELKELLKGENL